MQEIKKEKINKKIENNFVYNFQLKEDGIYIIKITATAKSWWQNFKNLESFFKDDDLAVKINSTEFPKINEKRGLFEAEAAWNGNNLRGLLKTNVFLTKFGKGENKIEFIADQNPTLKSIYIYKTNETELNLTECISENNPAQDGNRRQWIAVIVNNILIKELKIKASARKYPNERDEDDLKIIIDGEIQKNNEPKSHGNWFWCGRALDGKEKEFNRDLNLESGTHYIELWADRMPVINSLVLNLGEIENNGESRQPVKRIPAVDDPEWTGDFSDDTEQMILARAIWGETRGISREVKVAVAWSIKNRVGSLAKWDNYHNTILDKKQYSCFWEESPKDANLKALRSPLKNQDNYEKWGEVYGIVGQVMKGEIQDPINGANHYYDDSIGAPFWATKDNFVIKIGNIFFHKL